MSNRRPLLLLVASMSFGGMIAAPVDLNKAEAIAQDFLNSRCAGKRLAPRKTVSLSLAHKSKAATPDYYVFNASDGGGFVVVSGDDRTTPVLGYSDTGTIEPDKMPDGMKDMLQQYSDEIKTLDAANFAKEKAQPKRSVKNNVSVLLKSTWGQETPYCDSIPDMNPVGCVATALGQILRYHKWPEQTSAEIPSYTSGGTKYEALPVTTFNWDVMADNYENYYDKDSRAAVATLMRCLGYSVKMQYTGLGSGTYNDLVPYALNTYFGYPDARLHSRMDYSLSEWEDFVYKALVTDGPVFYTAQGSSLQGHAFVCDGYEGDGYFHFNWGWYGDLNGYFKLSALNVSQGLVSQLNWNHYIVTGIHRPEAGSKADSPLHLISRGLSTEDDGKQFTRRYSTDEYGPMKVYDLRTSALPKATDMEYTYGIYQNGTLVEALTNYVETKNSVLNNSFTRECKISFGSLLADGDYELRAISREKGTDEWQMDDWADQHHIAFTVKNKTLTPKTYYNGKQLVVSSVSYAGKHNGRPVYTVDVTNKGYQYDGSLFFMRTEEDSKYQEASFLIGPGEHKYARVALSRELTGGDSLRVSLDFMGSSVVYNNKLDSLAPKLTAHAEPINIEGGKILSGYFGVKATVQNVGDHDYHGGIGCRFYSYPDNKLIYEQATDADLLQGQSVDGDYIIPINPLTFSKYAEKQYVVKLVGYGHHLNAYGKWEDSQELYASEPLTLKPGVVFYSADGKTVSAVEATDNVQVPEEAEAVDLQYTCGNVKTVKGNSNPNCLYVTYWRDAQPSGLDNLNYVKTDKADNIKLVAGKGFYSLVDFTAANVEYTYNVEPDKWQTLTMPFDVSTSDMEADGLFVKEFVGEENGKVYFDDAQRVIGWQPLLVAGKAGERVCNAANVNFAEAQTGFTESADYNFCMTTTALSAPDAYVLSSDGKTFVKGGASASSAKGISPFGAYFSASSGNESPVDVLTVVMNGRQPTLNGVETVMSASQSPVTESFSIAGCRVNPGSAHGVTIERHADGSVTKRLYR